MHMNKNEMFNLIVERLSKEEFLKDFKFLKTYSGFKLKTRHGFLGLILESHRCPSWQMKSLNGDAVTSDFCIVEPFVGCQHEIKNYGHVDKWLDPFFPGIASHGSINLVIDPTDVGTYYGYNFSLAKENFEAEYNLLRRCAERMLNHFYENYSDLRAFYEKKVKLFLGEFDIKLYQHGTGWVFRYMFITKLVAPDDYSKMKENLMWVLNDLKERKEANFDKYEYRIPEMIEALEREADRLRPTLELHVFTKP